MIVSRAVLPRGSVEAVVIGGMNAGNYQHQLSPPHSDSWMPLKNSICAAFAA
jgi:hypothetical protein